MCQYERQDRQRISAYRHWCAIAMGAMLVLSGPLAGNSPAQDVAADAESASVLEFNISPQSLGSALNAFAVSSGWQISSSSELTGGLDSAGLSGKHTREKGLQILLSGTGLTYRVEGDRMLTIERGTGLPASSAVSSAVDGPASAEPDGVLEPPVKQKPIKVPEVVVKDVRSKEAGTPFVAEETSSGAKTATPLIATPQTINVITRAEMDTRMVQNVSQAVAYTPGVLTEMYGPVMRDDYFNIRGFDAPQFLDGLGLLGVNYANLRIEPYGLERVEVLKGPASMLYGQSPPGGLVNMTSKRATETPLREVLLLGGSFNRLQGGVDFGGPIDSAGRFLYRITGMVRDSDTQVDFAKDKRYFIAPTFTWRPQTNTSFTILGHFQKDDAGNTLQFLPPEGTLRGNPNGVLPINRFVGEPGFDRWKRQQYSIGYAFEHRFNEMWKIEQNFRYADVRTDYPTTFYLDFLRDGAGVPTDFRTISRLAGLYRDRAGTVTVDTRAQGNFDTGAITHQLLVGVDYRRVSGRTHRGFSNSPDLDIYAPVYGQSFDFPLIDFASEQQREQIGLYVQDQLKYERWVLTAGLRYDFANADTQTRDFFLGEASSTRQRDSALTYRAGLNYLFENGVSPYVSYSVSFQPEAGTNFAGTPFEPTTGQQYEAGIKYKPAGYNALVTIAAYQLTRQNIVTPDLDPGHFGFNVQTGEARVRGIEVEGKASLFETLNVTAGYSLTDSKITNSNNAGELGHRLSLTPRHQASLWLDHSFKGVWLAGLNLGGGMRYIGSNFGDIANSLNAPSYTLFDAAVRYDLRQVHSSLRGAELNVNLNNFLDNQYVATCADAACFYGARRTVYASLRYRW
ncbi:MAG: Iron complex outermembrane recepter protein [Nitrospira sp.]|nr:MAG: Iron complex outermembrane recepter protein [Nitrospira sp.]